MKKSMLWGGMLAATVVTTGAVFWPRPHWPEVRTPVSAASVVKRATAPWVENPPGSGDYNIPYDPKGRYLDRGKIKPCEESDTIKFDERGAAMYLVVAGLHHHPVMAAKCGLRAFVSWQAGGEGKESAIAQTNYLIEAQDERGAFPYPFPWRFYLIGEDLPAGWTSAMAQGQVLSLFARMYAVTKDERYLVAGRKALDYLLTPLKMAG